jgi:ferric-dicitrate binding protein FerR (iron transport regulator)
MAAKALPNLVPFAVDRRTVIAGLITFASSIAGARVAFAADPAGQVEMAKGLSTGLLNGGVRDLEVGSDVFLEELVQTYRAARLGLLLGGATRVNLGERTRLKIEKSVVEEGGQLLLERGALLFDGPPGDSAEEPLTRTPFAIIAARGTRYFVGPSNDVIGVFCESGSVSVRNRGGRVVLGAGEGTNLTSPDVAPTPPTRWGAPRVEAALASVT